MKRSGLPGGPSRSFAAISAALVVVAASAASAPEGQFEPKTGVALEVLPLQANYYAEPRIRLDFNYQVTHPQADGTAEAVLHNADTGEDFARKFPVELGQGMHWGWAAWGGNPPWTSSKDSELDLLLGGDAMEDPEVPDGYYIPQVTIRGQAGEVLAEQKYSVDEIKRMRVHGGLSQKISKETVSRIVADMDSWLAELTALESRARAAGADTSLPRLLMSAMRETQRQVPERLGAMQFNLVFQNHAYCARQVPKARAQLEQLIREPTSGVPADIFPRPKERMSFKDGYFHAGDKPVFMLGMCMFALWPDLELMREMNFNLVHIGANPLCLFPDDKGDKEKAMAAARERSRMSAGDALGEFPGGEAFGLSPPVDLEGLLQSGAVAPGSPAPAPATPAPDLLGPPVIPEPTGKLLVADYDPELTVRGFLDRCAELGIKVDLGLNMHPAPEWFFEKYPDARLQGYSNAGFIPFDIEHPAALAFTESFLDAAMKEVANHPALNSIWLANEPCMLNIGPRSAALFREAMQAKYATPEKLNAAWGTTYADFEAVKPGWDWTGRASPREVDFWWFNLGRLTNYFEFMQKCVRKYDKTVNTCFKLSNLQMGWHCPPGNVDVEGVSDISQITGCDSGTMPFAKPYYDFLRSLSPEKPVVNLEFKGTGWLAIWRAALWGMAGIDDWCWHGDPKFSPVMWSTASIHTTSLAMLGIQRNIDVVMAFQKFPRSPFVVVYPDPVLPRATQYFKAHTPAVDAIRYLGYVVDYATEKRIAAGRLDEIEYDIVVLPAANYISDDTFKTVGQFVEGGGKAIVVGDPPALGPMGAPRDLGWLKVPDGAQQGVAGCTNSVAFACGKGTVWMLPAADAKTLQPWIGEIAAKTLPPRPVVIDDAFEYRTIPWKNDKGEACYVTYILSNYYQKWTVEGDEPAHTVFATKVKDAVDLVTGEPIAPANITVPRGDLRIIQWTPEK